jgi:hypothetical protein
MKDVATPAKRGAKIATKEFQPSTKHISAPGQISVQYATSAEPCRNFSYINHCAEEALVLCGTCRMVEVGPGRAFFLLLQVLNF